MRVDNYYKLEDQKDEISKITEVNFKSKQNNVTKSINLLEGINSKSTAILSKLYKKDFTLGNYKM